MAWTAPRTWIVGEVLTAALLNTHLRDMALETAPALVTTKGDILAAAAVNDLDRIPVGANGTVLEAASGETAGVKWGTGPAAQADQAALEAETDENTYAPPDLIRHSPGVAKVYCHAIGGSGTIALQSGSFNVSSVTRSIDGSYTVNFTTNFSGTTHSEIAGILGAGDREAHCSAPAAASAGVLVQEIDSAFGFIFGSWCYFGFGDQ